MGLARREPRQGSRRADRSWQPDARSFAAAFGQCFGLGWTPQARQGPDAPAARFRRAVRRADRAVAAAAPAPLALRPIRIGDGRKACWLATNVLDPRELPKARAAERYRQRWQAEGAFRALKQTLGHVKRLRRNAEPARLERAGLALGDRALALLSLRARGRTLAERDCPPARTMEAARELLTGQAPPRGWQDRLRAALREPGWPRKRTRQTWVRKKTTRPPGSSKLRPATPAELQAAPRLSPPREVHGGGWHWRLVRQCRRFQRVKTLAGKPPSPP